MKQLPIPAAALGQHIIILGKTRSGKSSKARVIVEYLLNQEKPVCILDPKGDWSGLRSSGDGQNPGFPVVIFGGDHADYPITEHTGAIVAELIATGNRPAIVDLGGWMVGARTRFFIAFAEAFFKHSRGQRWLVIDEVHNFAPQSQGRIADVETGKMLHWANRLASEGSGKGINLISASQRPQKVSKDYVTSHETLIACRAIHPLDLKAMEDWMSGYDPARAREVRASLPKMQRPDAWVWSPEIDFGPKQITWPLFKTYDSFAAPTSHTVRKLKGWAAIQEGEISERLAKVAEEAKANDPKELRTRIVERDRRIVDLERQLAAKPAGASKEELGAEYDRGLADGQRQAASHATSVIHAAVAVARNAIGAALGELDSSVLTSKLIPPERKNRPVSAKPAPRESAVSAQQYFNSIAPETEPASPTVRKILDVIHRSHPVALTFEAAAARAAVSRRSSAYNSYRKQVEASPELVRREDGRFTSAPGYSAPVGPGTDPIAEFSSKLPPSYAKMLQAIASNGRALSKDEIAEASGVSPTSSGLTAGLSELIALGLVERDGNSYSIHSDLR